MKKLIILIVGWIAMTLSCSAATQGYKGVYVIHTNGTRTLVDLADGLSARLLDEQTMSIGVTDNSTEEQTWIPFFNITADKFEGFEMTMNTSAVEKIDADLALSPDIKGNRLIIRGAKPGTVASIYTADGKLFLSRELAQEDEIDLSDATPGIYIINLQGLSYKMIVK